MRAPQRRKSNISRETVFKYPVPVTADFKMALVELDPSLLATLKDKVVVLTGGATGIGRSAVEQFHGE